MGRSRDTFEDLRDKIFDSLSEVTKCYLLINYAYNTEEEIKLYRDEFKKRYINFYIFILKLEQQIDYNHLSGISDEIKKLLNINFYINKMEFLEDLHVSKDVSEIDTKIDSDYNLKTSSKTVKSNFYHNNNHEFGSTTKKHVNLEEFGPINPKAHFDDENTFVFSALTKYFINSYKGGLKIQKRRNIDR